MSVHTLRPPPSPVPRMTAKLRPSDLAILVTLDLDKHEVVWSLTPQQARDFGSWFSQWAMASERMARARTPKPRWLAWLNGATVDELAREAGLRGPVAEAVILRRDFRHMGGTRVRPGVPVPTAARITRTTDRSSANFGEWIEMWEPKERPGFTHPEEVEMVDGVGPKAFARIQAAGERLRPPHAELAPVVAIGRAT